MFATSLYDWCLQKKRGRFILWNDRSQSIATYKPKILFTGYVFFRINTYTCFSDSGRLAVLDIRLRNVYNHR